MATTKEKEPKRVQVKKSEDTLTRLHAQELEMAHRMMKQHLYDTPPAIDTKRIAKLRLDLTNQKLAIQGSHEERMKAALRIAERMLALDEALAKKI